MSNYADLKALVAAYVKQNGAGAISGDGLQTQLFNIINSLGAGYQFMGVATPATNPGTPDQNVFYIAGTEGTYTHFNNIVVENEVAVLKWNGSWAKQTTGAATAGAVSQLGQEVCYIGGGEYHFSPTIEQGTLSSLGIESSSNIRLRTAEFLICDSLTINAGNGKVSIFGYSDDFFIDYKDWSTGIGTYKIEGATKYKVVFSYIDNTPITPSDYDNLGVTLYGNIKGGLLDFSIKDKNYSDYLAGNFTSFGIINGKAIGQNGDVEINDEYSCTEQIYIPNGKYILDVNKLSANGITRIHGYKNGSWVKEIGSISSTIVGNYSYIFEVNNTEIDYIRISFRTDSTTLTKLQSAFIHSINEVAVNLEKGYYSTEANRYGLFTVNSFPTLINCKPILLNEATALAIRKDAKTVTLFFRSNSGAAISSVEISDIEDDAFVSIPNNSYYLDVEVSAPNIFNPDTATIITGKAISSNGVVENNPEYAYVDSIAVSNGSYILEVTKSSVNGITRIHGYKNGEWVKQINLINSGQAGSIACVFDISNNEIDEVKISYRRDSTSISKLLYSSNTNTENALTLFLYNCTSQPKEGKRIYKNNTAPIINPFIVGGPDELISCMCYMLPPNYTHNGNKIPLIVWFDGSGGYPTLTSSFQDNKLPGLSYMRDEGYAIMQVFAWGAEYAVSCPDCGNDMPYPTRTCLRTIKEAIKFMVDRYNIDADNVHIVSKSFGGIISSYFTLFPIWNFKSIGMFSPCIDVLSMRGRFLGGRLALIKDLDLQGEYVEDFKDISESGQTQTGVENYFFSPRCQNLWLDNFTKLMSINAAWIRVCEAGYNEKYLESLADARAWWNTGGESVPDKYDAEVYTNIDRHRVGKVPCKLWIPTHDSDTPHQIMLEFVEQLKNCGCYAEATIIEGGSHSSPDFDYTEPVTTKLGIYYESVAIGWRENIEWIRRNSLGDI